MEQIMGQIEADVLCGNEPKVAIPAVPGRPIPPVRVSPTGVITKNPNAPATLPPEKPGPLKSALDFLKKPAGPLPIYGWSLIGLGTATIITIVVASVHKRY